MTRNDAQQNTKVIVAKECIGWERTHLIVCPDPKQKDVLFGHPGKGCFFGFLDLLGHPRIYVI